MYKPDNYNNKQNMEPKFSKTKTIPSKSFYLSSFPRCNKQQANFSFHFIGDFSGKCRESKKLTMFQYWVDRDKPMNQQIGLSGAEPVLRFMVKFYIPDPSQLEEEYTRYLFSMQIKRDLATGHLQCNDNTAALMASYIVQGKS